MSSEILTAARSVLLDALEALASHRQALVLIGAQAIYLHTGAADVALAETTKDSDLALDTRLLAREPLLEDAMRRAEFALDPRSPQPGSWLGRHGLPVDLMVPEALAGKGGRRGARIPPHSKLAVRRARGLEAAVVDHVA
ncbi:MAG: GSU2403 family nucleotidyltransferase fold protein [Solirubrobacteraceae bacterium]